MTVLEAAPATVAPERRRLMGSAYDLSGATDADSARVLAGLEWEPTHRPLYVDLPDDQGMALVEKERAVVRSDNAEMFGVVGREHQLLSNAEMFGFADTLLSEADTTWATSSPFGGSLADGKQPFLAFQLGEGVQVAGSDAVDCAVLLSNGHVGNASFSVTVTPIRMQCSNVVRATIRAGKQSLAHHTVQHSGDLTAKVAEARAALALTSAYMKEFEALANSMADTAFALSDFDDFLVELVPLKDGAGGRAEKTVADTRGAFRLNWLNTTTIDAGLKSTAWGALNIVTEMIDHGSLDVRKSRVGADERRMQSVHHGAGSRMRDRAFHLLAGV